MQEFPTLKGRAFPKVFWIPLRAAATETGEDRRAWIAAETASSSLCPLYSSTVIMIRKEAEIEKKSFPEAFGKIFLAVKTYIIERGRCLLRQSVRVSQQQLWQPGYQVLLHPLPVERQYRNALRISCQCAASIPEMIQPLQQLKDLHIRQRTNVAAV